MINSNFRLKLFCIFLMHIIIFSNFSMMAYGLGQGKEKMDNLEHIEFIEQEITNPIANTQLNGNYIFYDDFESGNLSSNWTIKIGYGSAGVGNHTSNSGNYSMYTCYGAVNVTTKSFNLSSYNIIMVGYWIRRGGKWFSNYAYIYRNLIIEYLNSNNKWIKLDTFFGGGLAGENYTKRHILPSDALHDKFKLRFRQTIGYGSDYDYWHIDDVYLLSPDDHDIEVVEIDVPEYGRSQNNTKVMARIQNIGKTNESDIQIELKINGSIEDSKNISTLSIGEETSISFNWTPTNNGIYSVEIYAKPVSNENFTINNQLNDTINVTSLPEIWINPDKLELTAMSGSTTQYNLSLGNKGNDNLSYRIYGGAKAPEYSVLVIDGDHFGSKNTTRTLKKNGFNMTLFNLPSKYNGTPDPSEFDAVFLINGNSWGVEYLKDMPLKGQSALNNYVENGGGILLSAMFPLHIDNNRYKILAPMSCFGDFSGHVRSYDYYYVIKQHTITNGVNSSFTVSHGRSERTALPEATALVWGDASWDYDLLAYKKYGLGRVVHFATMGEYPGLNAWKEPNMVKLLVNSLYWLSQATNKCDWLEIKPNNGTINVSKSTFINITANATSLEPGFYQKIIAIKSNDQIQRAIPVPLNFTVLSGSHDIRVWNITMPNKGRAGQSIPIRANILNQGSSNENNITIQLIVNSAVLNSTNISTLSSGKLTEIELIWTPMKENISKVEIYIVPVIGDNTSNNGLNDTLEIKADAKLWLNQYELNFSVIAGNTVHKEFTFGNSGLKELDWEIVNREYILKEDFEDGNWTGWNDVNIVHDKEINSKTAADGSKYSIKLSRGSIGSFSSNFTPSQPKYISLFIRSYYIISNMRINFLDDSWNDLAYFYTSNNEKCRFMTSSGSFDVYCPEKDWHHLEWKDINWTDKHYDIYFNGDLIAENAVFRDMQMNNITKIYLKSSSIYFGGFDEIEIYDLSQNLPFWLSVNNNSGIIESGNQTKVIFTANASNLEPGIYHTNFTIQNIDKYNGSVQVPVNFTVQSAPHDIRILKLDSPSKGLAGKKIIVNSTILNQGTNDESNITIQLKVDGIVVNSTNISLLAKGAKTKISLGWIPLTESLSSIEIHAVPVVLENRIFNNQLNNTINISAYTKIWYNPKGYNISLVRGNSTQENLTISNIGYKNLDWQVVEKTPYFQDDFEDGDFNGWKIGSGTYTRQVTSTTAAAGSKHSYTQTGSGGIGTYATFTPCKPDYISVYVRSSSTATHDTYFFVSDSPGRRLIHFFARNNGSFSLASGSNYYYYPYSARKWYHLEFKEIDWENNQFDFYIDGNLKRKNTSFSGNPSYISQINMFNFNNAQAWYDEIFIGNTSTQIPNWLDITPDNGTIPVSNQTNISISINTGQLFPGFYQAKISIKSNDHKNEYIFIPVNLTILKRLYDVSISPTSKIGYCIRNSTIEYNLTIINEGRKNDTYNLSIQGNNWTTEIYNISTMGKIASIFIPKNGSKKIVVKVNTPSFANNSDYDEVQFKIISQNNSYLNNTASIMTFLSNPLPWNDSFDKGYLSRNWSVEKVSAYGEIGLGSETSNDGKYSMWSSGGATKVTTVAFNTLQLKALNILFWVRRGGSFSEQPDINDDLVVEYLNQNLTWVMLDTFYGGGTPGKIFNNSYNLTGDALHTGFRLRFRQTAGDQYNDLWHIDSVYIIPKGLYGCNLFPKDNVSYGKVNSSLDHILKIKNSGQTNDTYILSGTSDLSFVIRNINNTENISKISVNSGATGSFIVRINVPINIDPSKTYLTHLKAISENITFFSSTAKISTVIPNTIPWFDDFDTGSLGSDWTVTSSGGTASVSTQTSKSSSYSMYTRGGVVEVTTCPFDTTSLNIIRIAFWVRRGGAFSERPDNNENLIVEYLDSTDTWIVLDTFLGSGTAGEIYQRSHNLSGKAIHKNFKLRIRQTAASSSAADYWHIDDVYVGPQFSYINIIPATNSSFQYPGKKIDHIITLQNTASFDKTFILSVSSTWDVVFRDFADTVDISTINVTQGVNVSIIVRITIPSNAKPGDGNYAKITVASQKIGYIRDTTSISTFVPLSIPWFDNFDDGDLGNNWSVVEESGYAGISTHTSNSGSYSMYTNGGIVSVTTLPFNTNGIDVLKVSFWIRRGSPFFSEQPDFNEDLIVEYLNSNNKWIKLDIFIGFDTPGQILYGKYNLVGDALHMGFRLRFRQTGGNGGTNDYWHIDDVRLKAIPPVKLNVSGYDLTPQNVTQEQTNIVMANFTFTPVNSFVEINTITLNLTGTGSDSDISEIRLAHDTDNNGVYSSSDVILAKNISYQKKITFLISWVIDENTFDTFFVLFNISDRSVSQIGKTIGIRLSYYDVQVASPCTLNPFKTIQSTNATILEKRDVLSVIFKDLAPYQAEQGQKDVPVISLQFKVNSGNITLEEIEIDFSGSGNPSFVDNVKLYNDSNGNGYYDSGIDELLGTKKFTGYNLTFDQLSRLMSENVQERFLILFDVASNATLGKTLGVSIWPDYIRVNEPDLVQSFFPVWGGPFNVIEREDITAPPPPTGLRIKEISHNSISLAWNENTEDDLVGYNIYRSMTTNPSSWGEPINGLYLVKNEEYIDNGLLEITNYYYVITALDEVPNESNYSKEVSGTTLISPRRPYINNSINDFSILEDSYDYSTINLYYWFADINGDKLNFRCEGQKHIGVIIIQDNGKVFLNPETDWSGKEKLTFYAWDNDFKPISDEITVTVKPVNDAPGPAEILVPSEQNEIGYGEILIFKGSCSDPDINYGDVLTFNWISNLTGHLGNGNTLENITLPIGSHLITLEVTDSVGKTSKATIFVTVLEKPESDTDNDGMPNLWERKYGFDPFNPLDADRDPDQDGLPNYQEYKHLTNPQKNDTDNDGVLDGNEVLVLKTNPTNPDTDGDNYNDSEDDFPLDNTKWKKEDFIPEIKPGDSERKDPGWLILGIVLIIIIIVIILIILLLIKRKKPIRIEPPQMQPTASPEKQIQQPIYWQSQLQPKTQTQPQSLQPPQSPQSQVQPQLPSINNQNQRLTR